MNEVTFENNLNLNFYNKDEKMKEEMEFMYRNFISKDKYQSFWDSYRKRYFKLKKRYREAYKLKDDF